MASIESMESLRTTAGPSAMPANGAVLMRAWVMAHALQHDVPRVEDDARGPPGSGVCFGFEGERPAVHHRP